MWLEKIRIAPQDRVFVLTGAGISAESGLPTFRASDGLWAGHRVEDVCTPEALEENPELVWQFYSERRAQGAKATESGACCSGRTRSEARRSVLSLHTECG